MDAAEVLAGCGLFNAASARVRAHLAEHASFVELQGGQALFEPGDAADCFYIVADGRLRAEVADGRATVEVGCKDSVGEIGAFSGEPRTTAAYAIRDSVLLRVSVRDLLTAVREEPEALLAITSLIVRRLRDSPVRDRLRGARSLRIIAVVPLSESNSLENFACCLGEALNPFGSTLVISAESLDAQFGKGSADRTGGADQAQLSVLLNQLEAQHSYIVYLASPSLGAWTQRCLRQADRIIAVVDHHDPVATSELTDALRLNRSRERAPVDVVTVRPDHRRSSEALRWCERVRGENHFFVRPGVAADFSRLARQLTGRGVGLVLGGGGARGFAHIGLLRALQELEIPVDLIGGTSIGAFIGGLAACGHQAEDITDIARETFVSRHYLNDYTLPRSSLIRGRKFRERLDQLFGTRRIEELRTPFYCVSTNLTQGNVVVHREGLLSIWIGTSMAVPGFAPPVAYMGDLLADGSIIDSLPTGVMREMRRGPIIASDVSTEGAVGAPGVQGPDPDHVFGYLDGAARPGLFSIVFRTATLSSESGGTSRAARADHYLRMPVTDVGLFDWKMIDTLIERGYSLAMTRLQPLRAQLLSAAVAT